MIILCKKRLLFFVMHCRIEFQFGMKYWKKKIIKFRYIKRFGYKTFRICSEYFEILLNLQLNILEYNTNSNITFKNSNLNSLSSLNYPLKHWIAKSPIYSSSEMMKLYWLCEICVRWKRNDGQLTIAPCSDCCLFHGAPFTFFLLKTLPLFALSLSLHSSTWVKLL